jgi:hypothetical protein
MAPLQAQIEGLRQGDLPADGEVTCGIRPDLCVDGGGVGEIGLEVLRDDQIVEQVVRAVPERDEIADLQLR